MIVGMNDVLHPAREGKYAVGMFNAVTSDTVSYTHLTLPTTSRV